MILITSLRTELADRSDQVTHALQDSKKYLEAEVAAKKTARKLEKELLNLTVEMKELMLTNIELKMKNDTLHLEVELHRKESLIRQEQVLLVRQQLEMTLEKNFELPGPSDA